LARSYDLNVPSKVTYPVSVVDDVTPRMTPEEVALIVLAKLGSGGSIDRMTLISDARDLATVEPRAGGGLMLGGPLWVVRAHGSFVSKRGGLGRRQPLQQPTGYLVADRDGHVAGMGMP
jgi:hypothetical protein